MKTKIHCVLFSTFLGGCAGHIEKPIPVNQLSSAFGDIKRQLLIYELKVAPLHPGQLSTENDTSAAKMRRLGCGSGAFHIVITEINLSLITSSTTDAGGSVGFAAPVGAIPVSASVYGSRSTANSQALEINMLPVSTSKISLSEKELSEPAPISDQLLNIRDSLIRSAEMSGKCLAVNNKSIPGNTYKIGIEITDVGGAKANVTLAPIDIGISGQNKSVTGNQITVEFVDVGPNYKAGTPIPKRGVPMNEKIKIPAGAFRDITIFQ